MDNEDNRKRLERHARALILSKEISLEDKDTINAYMRDQNLSYEDRYTNIIKLLKKSPDKEVGEIDDDKDQNQDTKKPQAEHDEKQAQTVHKAKQTNSKEKELIARRARGIYAIGPTKSKLYISDIYHNFKEYKFFKIRYIVRRDNKLGYGWNKRLIPTKRFLVLMDDIKSFQDTILSRLNQILEIILKDESIVTPLEFNYLRSLRRWMRITPFANIQYEKIKWMEQANFERELKSYVIYFHSFLRMNVEIREVVIALVEKILRKEPDLIKDEISGDEEKTVLVQKEKDNYNKEKYISEYLGSIRSFMAIHKESDSLLAEFLKEKYGIPTLEETLNIAIEALVFHKPFTDSELREYFDIKPISVSSVMWDLNSERLKIYGKDAESMKKKRLEKLKRDLFWYDTLYQAVKIDDAGKNILVKSVEDLWKYIDHSNRDAEESLKTNFIVFLEGLISYFKNLIAPLLNGKPIIFDLYGNISEGAIFSQSFFFDDLIEIESLSNEVYNFKNENPTLKVTSDEINKIITKKISSMNHVEGIVYKIGSVFYTIGEKLQEVYNNHVKTVREKKTNELRTTPLEIEDRNKATCVPYSMCVFKGFEESTPLVKRIEGRKILNDSLKGGLLIFIMSYCYQTAFICGNSQIKNILTKREIIKREIEGLKGGVEDTKEL
ncbi:MAG: hypothetical protein FWF73_05310 [Spirochaetes bacterium]|nr:hypothetical protein [Spirochaetota bacterium]